jgi:hypothetical protein
LKLALTLEEESQCTGHGGNPGQSLSSAYRREIRVENDSETGTGSAPRRW